MNNELRILPLREYEVTYGVCVDQHDMLVTDKFTADFHDVSEGRFTRFYRTGNIIREYHLPLISIVVTPADGEKIPA